MLERTCQITSCESAVHAHGLCSAHAHRLRRYGDPTAQPSSPSLADRWSAKVKIPIDGIHGCWIWQGFLNEHGYGVISVGGRSGRMTLAHRVAWELVNGPIPEGMIVRHACDTPSCVNRRHLALGTPQDNSNDTVERGRQARGQDFPQAKLTPADVQAIRDATDETQRSLAKRFGVAQSVISGIVRHERWKHVQ